jgi:hypothetical protein
MNRLRRHLSYANITATLSLFLILGGGTALASYVISSNSQIGPNTISGHKPPTGDHANIIGGSVSALDLAHPGMLGAGLPSSAGGTCSGITNHWSTIDGLTVRYYRDVNGRVHLQGLAKECGTVASGTIFVLPAGYRPNEVLAQFPILRSDTGALERLSIDSGGDVSAFTQTPGATFSLDGVSFRCGPSGQNGCP